MSRSPSLKASPKPVDPIAIFRRLFRRASRGTVQLPEAMVLATADTSGRPAARVVLLKGVDARGFVFFTNQRSHKGSELEANPHAALVFHWVHLGKQVRVEGCVEHVSAAEADAYWRTRPRASQLAAVISAQSQPIDRRETLVARQRAAAARYRRQPVPRPAHWGGYCLVPEAIEFWTHRSGRLHDRVLFTRGRRGWTAQVLQP